MKYLQLKRCCHTDKYGVFGKLFIDNKFCCYTVERPWQENKPYVSCIPCRAYLIQKGTFRNEYENYEIKNVPDRTHIEIHRANVADDVQGCIGLGLELGVVDGKWAVLESRAAMGRFVDEMQGDEYAVMVVTNEKGP